MFGPLSFPNNITNTNLILFDTVETFTECILCDLKFKYPEKQNELLMHIFNLHKLVIADVPCIASLPKYLSFWKIRFQNSHVEEYCTTVLVDVERDGIFFKDQEYFLLSDIVPEDKELREGLQKKRLEWALDQQKTERQDNLFERGCLFCRLELKGSRAKYIEHLSSQHNLQIGRPYNLVFIDQLIDKIEQKIENLQCLYCEKLFKDRNVLKEHMRKKSHKRINPENKEYDRFYLVNYIEMGKNWKEQTKIQNDSSGSDDETDWSDWKEEEEPIVCLFCNFTTSRWNDVMSHIHTVHQFPYETHTKHLNFYQQVKVVNYIRRQVHRQNCITCDLHFHSNESLLKHMEKEAHFVMPSIQLWDQPEYFFPTYENDSFLCQIEDNEDEDTETRLYPSSVPETAEIVQRLQKLLDD